VDEVRGSGAERGGGGGAVVVAQPGSEVEAQLIAGLLASNGIRAAVLTDDAGGAEPQLQLSGVRVVTSPEDADDARSLLARP
jgi:hypothetical protein